MRRALFLIAPTILVALGGCSKLTATTEAVSVLTRTPDVSSAQDMDPNLTSVLPLDALDVNAAGIVVWVGNKQSVSPQDVPAPVTGAQVSVSWGTQNNVSLCENTTGNAQGTYSATSIPTAPCGKSDLTYEPNAKYTTTISTGSDTYTLSVTAPAPVAASNVTFSPALQAASNHDGASLKSHTTGAALTVDWSADPAASGKNVFVTVFRINYTGTGTTGATNAANWTADPNNPVFDNLPRQPADMLKLIIGSPATSAQIDGSTFSQTGIYFVVVTPTDLSTNTSDNLALGSSALAGVGTAFVFWVD